MIRGEGKEFGEMIQSIRRIIKGTPTSAKVTIFDDLRYMVTVQTNQHKYGCKSQEMHPIHLHNLDIEKMTEVLHKEFGLSAEKEGVE
jgi:hypothetical protein